MLKRDLLSNLKKGTAGGLAVASVYCIWITVIYLTKGEDAFERQGLTFRSLLLVYLAGGGLAGGVVGACRPWAKSTIGSRIIAVIAMLPLIFGLEVLIAGNPSRWAKGEGLIVVGLATAFGWFMADSLFGREDD